MAKIKFDDLPDGLICWLVGLNLAIMFILIVLIKIIGKLNW